MDFSRYLEIFLVTLRHLFRISGKIFRRFYVISVWRPSYASQLKKQKERKKERKTGKRIFVRSELAHQICRCFRDSIKRESTVQNFVFSLGSEKFYSLLGVSEFWPRHVTRSPPKPIWVGRYYNHIKTKTRFTILHACLGSKYQLYAYNSRIVLNVWCEFLLV